MQYKWFGITAHRVLAMNLAAHFSGSWVWLKGRNVWQCSCGWRAEGATDYAAPNWKLCAHLEHWHEPDEVFAYINHAGAMQMTAKEIIEFPERIKEWGRQQRARDERDAHKLGLTLSEYRKQRRVQNGLVRR